MPLEQDIQHVFSTSEGERVLRHLMATFGIWHAHPHPTDGHTLSFREGQRDVVLFIMHNMMDEKDKEAFAQWMADQLNATGYDKPVDSSVGRYFGD